MTIQRAKEVLEQDAIGKTEQELESWIAGAEGLTVVFFGQLETGIINKTIDND